MGGDSGEAEREPVQFLPVDTTKLDGIETRRRDQTFTRVTMVRLQVSSGQDNRSPHWIMLVLQDGGGEWKFMHSPTLSLCICNLYTEYLNQAVNTMIPRRAWIYKCLLL